MINNKEILNHLMSFDTEGDFYFIQVIKRKKENPEVAKSERTVSSYYVYSFEDLEKKWDDIVHDCALNDARAYMWVNKRNDEKIALQMLRVIAESISNKTYKVRKVYNSVCGKFHSEPEKKWVVDIDVQDFEDLGNMMLWINTIPPTGCKLVLTVPTVNGIHLITKPFDINKFKEKFSVDIQKDNPTILYYHG